MGVLWDFHWISMGFPLDFNGSVMGFSLDFTGCSCDFHEGCKTNTVTETLLLLGM